MALAESRLYVTAHANARIFVGADRQPSALQSLSVYDGSGDVDLWV